MLSIPRAVVVAAEAGAVARAAAPVEAVLEGGLSKKQRTLMNALEVKMQTIGCLEVVMRK